MSNDQLLGETNAKHDISRSLADAQDKLNLQLGGPNSDICRTFLLGQCESDGDAGVEPLELPGKFRRVDDVCDNPDIIDTEYTARDDDELRDAA